MKEKTAFLEVKYYNFKGKKFIIFNESYAPYCFCWLPK